MKEGLFEKNMSLSEMDAVLEHFLTEESSTIRILVDIPLTEEEYIQLSDKLIGMKRNMANIQRYRISMLMAWAYALYYGRGESKEYCEIMSGLDEMPQYFTRQFFRLCSRTFEEFGLNTYFPEICSKQQLCGGKFLKLLFPREPSSFCQGSYARLPQRSLYGTADPREV